MPTLYYEKILNILTDHANLSYETVKEDLKSKHKKLIGMSKKDRELKLKLSGFINVEDGHVGLLDCILFCIVYDIAVIFENRLSFLNPFFSINDEEKIIITIINEEFKIVSELNQEVAVKYNNIKNIIKRFKHLVQYPIIGINKTSDVIVKNLTLTSNSYNDDHIDENDQIKFHKILNKENLIHIYDCDGIYGICKLKHFSDCINQNFFLNINKNSKAKILQRSYSLFGNNKPISLKNCFSFSVGKIQCDFGIVNVFLFFTKNLNEDEMDRVKQDIYSTVLNTVQDMELNLANMRILTNLSINEIKLNGLIDKKVTGLLFLKLYEHFKSFSPLLYLDLYNTKISITEKSLFNIIDRICIYFKPQFFLDFSADICFSFCKSNDNNITSLPKTFFNNVDEYNILFCNNLSNYNKKCISIKNKKIVVTYNGIKKINAYSTFPKAILPKTLFENTLPKLTRSAIIDKYFKFSQENKNLEQLKQTLVFNNKLNYDNSMFPYRVELTVHLFNVLDLDRVYTSILNERYITTIKTSYAIHCAQHQIEEFKKMFNNVILIDIKSYFKLLILEILLSEFFVKGGKNLHIIPKILKEHVFSIKSDNTLPSSTKSIIDFLNYKNIVTSDEMKTTIFKIFNNYKIHNISCSEKNSIIDFLFTEDKDQIFLNLKNQIILDYNLNDLNSKILNFKLYDKISYFDYIVNIINSSYTNNHKYLSSKFILILLANNKFSRADITTNLVEAFKKEHFKYVLLFNKNSTVTYELVLFNNEIVNIQKEKDNVLRNKFVINKKYYRKTVHLKEIAMIRYLLNEFENVGNVYKKMLKFYRFPLYINNKSSHVLRWNLKNFNIKQKKQEKPSLEEKQIQQMLESFNIDTYNIYDFLNDLKEFNYGLGVEGIKSAYNLMLFDSGKTIIELNDEDANKIYNTYYKENTLKREMDYNYNSDFSIQINDYPENQEQTCNLLSLLNDKYVKSDVNDNDFSSNEPNYNLILDALKLKEHETCEHIKNIDMIYRNRMCENDEYNLKSNGSDKLVSAIITDYNLYQEHDKKEDIGIYSNKSSINNIDKYRLEENFNSDINDNFDTSNNEEIKYIEKIDDETKNITVVKKDKKLFDLNILKNKATNVKSTNNIHQIQSCNSIEKNNYVFEKLFTEIKRKDYQNENSLDKLNDNFAENKCFLSSESDNNDTSLVNNEIMKPNYNHNQLLTFSRKLSNHQSNTIDKENLKSLSNENNKLVLNTTLEKQNTINMQKYAITNNTLSKQTKLLQLNNLNTEELTQKGVYIFKKIVNRYKSTKVFNSKVFRNTYFNNVTRPSIEEWENFIDFLICKKCLFSDSGKKGIFIIDLVVSFEYLKNFE